MAAKRKDQKIPTSSNFPAWRQLLFWAIAGINGSHGGSYEDAEQTVRNVALRAHIGIGAVGFRNKRRRKATLSPHSSTGQRVTTP
jgi:hypothetical protein